MAELKWMDAQVQAKRIYNLLGEVEDLSQQLVEAVDRNDQVTIQMLLSMREEPLQKLCAAKDALEQQVYSVGDRDAVRLRALLNGAPAQQDDEQPLAEQVASNARLLARVQELDRSLNRKITRGQSIYD